MVEAWRALPANAILLYSMPIESCACLVQREHCDLQVYSGAASETAFIGKESPGPMAYDQHRSGIGRQVSTPAPLCCAALRSAWPEDLDGSAYQGHTTTNGVISNLSTSFLSHT